LSLSTATPSLGGALPKLATLKIGYEVYHNNYQYDGSVVRAAGFISADFSKQSRKLRRPISMRAQSSLSSSALEDVDEDESPSTINVLATQTEASMSSSSFAIPRRSTIDADVSLSFFFCLIIYLFSKLILS
jgi:hypothetical protein